MCLSPAPSPHPTPHPLKNYDSRPSNKSTYLSADVTGETRVMPMTVIVGGDVLRLGPDLHFAGGALVYVFHTVAILTNRFTLSRNKLLACDAGVAFLAPEVAEMPTLIHRYCVFPREDQLLMTNWKKGSTFLF